MSLSPNDPPNEIERTARALNDCNDEVRAEICKILWREDLRRFAQLGLELAGLVIGASLALLGLYFAYDLIRTGNTASAVGGTVLGLGDFGALVGTFVYGAKAGARRDSSS